MESPVRAPAGPHRKPKADIYTVLLAIALVAILTAIVFLWLELAFYDYKSKGGPMVSVTSGQWLVASGQWLV